MHGAPVSEAYEILVNRHNWGGACAHMRSTLMTWDWRWHTAFRHREVAIDFREVEFMEPWAIAMFACFARALQDHSSSVRVELNPANPSNVYFERIGLRTILDSSASRAIPERDSTGLCVLNSTSDAERFARLAAALIRPMDEAAADRVEYCVKEFGYNAAQHAQSRAGAVALAQRFPDSRAVQIVVCDTGRGVRASLNAPYPELRTDLEALRLAMLPRTSGAATPGPYGGAENQGLGLFFSKEIAWRTGGSFWLASGDALVGVAASEENGATRIHRKISPWNGTLAAIHLPDTAVSDFAEILEVCHELVHELERNAIGAGLDFIDDSAELPDDVLELDIGPVQNSLADVHAMRSQHLAPAVAEGRQVVLNFKGVRFLPTSIGAALLSETFRVPGVVTKLMFRNCSRPTELAIRTVAAAARVTYRRRPE